MKTLAAYSIGVGDRFGAQGVAQLAAVGRAAARGVTVVPVWNKSHREHTIVGTTPADQRAAADRAVAAAGWTGAYHVDADHVGLASIDGFVAHCDYFTLDVADSLGQPAEPAAVAAFLRRHGDLAGEVRLADVAELRLGLEELAGHARRCLAAVAQAGRVYRRLAAARPAGDFIVEVSLDETAAPQTPAELLVLLAGLADEGVPVQAVAPRFAGRFLKGVAYEGDPAVFARDFACDVAVVAFGVRHLGLPATLKLSVHSGSDKFALYPPMHRILRRQGAGVHLKTAGTTWLEEVIGLAETGGEGLRVAQAIYAAAHARRAELCGPYAAVVDIAAERLPVPAEVAGWDGARFAAALRHDAASPHYNADLRQLLHVGYKVAAELGPRFRAALAAAAPRVAEGVETNLFARHIAPLFLGEGGAGG